VRVRNIPTWAVAISFIALAGCGNSGSGPITNDTPVPVNNVQSVVVDAGPFLNGSQIGANNILYTSVTLCVPGTANCQTIDHVQVDTGSSGLRILGAVLTLPLPRRVDGAGNPISNCVQYADLSYQWGPLATADIQMAGEGASSVPIQIAGATGFTAAPSACSAGGAAADTVLDLGANGILGVGLYRQDCGPACTNQSGNFAYYSCPASGCVLAPVALAGQLQNPVWMFSQDNNGLLISLPSIASSGQPSVFGSMIFGIGTQSNNALGGAGVEVPDNAGGITTTFNGVRYSGSVIDAGSNGIFFLDSATTQLPDCSSQSIGQGFYCPGNPVNFTAITTGTNTAVSGNPSFTIANAAPLLNSPNTAFNNLGGPRPGTFDWGLPFFFGRNVFVAIESQSTPAGAGPYWAF
jgi:hypothetical protein